METIVENAADAGFDLSDLDTASRCEAGAEVELTHPVTGKPLGMFVTVYGKHSEVFRNTMNENINERNAADAAYIAKGETIPVRTVEQGFEENTKLLAKCTKSWRGFKLNGKKLEFSYENAVMVYTKWHWMREQIDRAIGKLENFMKP